jgi:ribosomal protein S18 acetylase RimI-like enzyme
VGRGRVADREERRIARFGDLITIRRLADNESDVALGQSLVREYVAATAEEVALPGAPADIEAFRPYIPDWDDFAGRFLHTGGGFVVADVDGELAGSVGVTPIDGTVCEMNRLWVREPFRRAGVGRALAEASMALAVDLGFTRMILDVVPTRTNAIALYRSMGFGDAELMHEYAFPMVGLARDLPATGR